MSSPRPQIDARIAEIIKDIIAHGEHLELCNEVRRGKIKVTAEMMAAVTNPQWRQELVQAICLSKVSNEND